MKSGSMENRNPSSIRSIFSLRNDRVLFPQMVLIAGDGRNVGKTTLSMQIVRKLSAKAEVIGMKTTPHKHVLTEGLEILAETGDYRIALEKGDHDKDSALLLKAGASKVFLIMAAQQNLGKAFFHISASIKDKICIAESGGLAEYVEPAVFFFIRNQGGEIRKKHYLEFDPVVVTNRDMTFDFAADKLDVADNKLVIND